MTTPTTHAYTDSPAQHPNLVWGLGQLLVWFFFHPTAWRNFLSRVAPHLGPDCTLGQLIPLRHHVAVRRLLLQIYLLVPLLIGLSVSLILWLKGGSLEVIMGTTAYVVGLSVTLNLIISLVVSVAAGMICCLTMGLATGPLPLLMPYELTSPVAISIAIVLVGGIASLLTDQQPQTAPSRQVAGVLIGLLVGVVAIGGVRQGLTILGSVSIGLSDTLAYYFSRSAVVGLSFGLAWGWRQGWRRGLGGGLVVAIGYLMAVYGWSDQFRELLLPPYGLILLQGLASGLLFGLSFGVTFVLPYILASHIAGPWAGVGAGVLGSAGRHVVRNQIPFWPAWPLSLGGIILGLMALYWRSRLLFPLMGAWNLILFRLDSQHPDSSTCWLGYHSAFWDEFYPGQLPGLDEHLLLILQTKPAEGQAAFDYLRTSRHRWAAQAVQIELEARRLEACQTITELSQVHRQLVTGELVGPASAILHICQRISQDVEAALSQATSYNQRLALRSVDDRLHSFSRELTASSEPYAVRFHPLVRQWEQLVMAHLTALAETVEYNQEIDNPYIVGVPLTEQQDIFVGRTEIVSRIEQLLLDRRRPPLLLYGQRRMGKTSLLRNLGRLLPTRVVPLFVDGQRVALAANYGDFLHNLAREMMRSAKQQRGMTLPAVDSATIEQRPFSYFNEWLDEVEDGLTHEQDSVALLALDEFEALEQGVTKGRFDEQDLFSLLRHIIQHRPRFKVMLAGSHTLEEFQRWASYLINVQVIKIDYLAEAEARQLIEQPVTEFALRYEPVAVERVLQLTRGHPAMVQLLCYEIITLKNEQPTSQRRLVTLADVTAAIAAALDSGSFFFADVAHNQVEEAGRIILNFIASRGEAAVVDQAALTEVRLPDGHQLGATLATLVNRDLLERVELGYRFQVELIRRWFANNE